MSKADDLRRQREQAAVKRTKRPTRFGGRPPKGDDGLTAHVPILLTKREHKAVRALAKANGTSVSALIRALVRGAL